MGRNFFHFVVDQIQAQLTGEAYRQVHEEVEGFFAGRRVRDVEQHAEAFVGLVVQKGVGKRVACEAVDGKHRAAGLSGVVECAVFAQYEAEVFNRSAQFDAADVAV